MSRGQCQRRTDHHKRRCKFKGKAADVIDIDVIDIDVIIIDSVKATAACEASTSGKQKAAIDADVICIDDDDGGGGDDGSGDCSNDFDGFEGGNWDSDSQPSSSLGRGLSKNDDSDCYVEEDNMGTIRQQWEEASHRKKMSGNVTKGHSGFQDEVGLARSTAYSQNNLNVDKMTEAQTSNGNRNHHENDNLNGFACFGLDGVGAGSKKFGRKSRHADLVEITPQEMYKRPPVNNTQVLNGRSLKRCENSHSQVVSNGDVQGNILGDRENLKKTDAYKRAQEEEWASRQKVLRIQAEEAQRMRKRKKAETQRLLETERRQKQRLEEVREAQKKDEETLNLKEQLRLEVRRELDKLEVNCRDMPSLLRGLGIHTGGDSSQVRAACKQAMFRFHPDRASRSNIREQIEAEEKFKLISRLKEKFMLQPDPSNN